MMDWKNKFALLSLLLCFVCKTFGQFVADHEQIDGEVIIRLSGEVSIESFLQQINQNKAQGQAIQLKKTLGPLHNIQLLAFDSKNTDFNQILKEFQSHPSTIAAQANYTLAPRTTPNDAEYNAQWDMEIIQAPKVWDISTGGLTANGDTIVVAIVDSGFDENHEDLVENLWRNPGEIPGDGIDNDGNSLIDDVHGWSFNNNSGNLIYDNHGTAVTGIVGARGNNEIGVTGLNWNVKLMLFDIDNVSDALEAYEYIIDQRTKYNESNGQEGAFVVATNASFGQRQRFCDDQPVWGGMYDLLGAVGVLTGAGTANSAWDVEEEGDMPTTCPSDFIITVLNTNVDDRRHQSSAYGKISIDMGAPGEGTFTVSGFDRYGSFGGNSAAAPHLTGAIALLYSLPCNDLANEALTRPSQTALRIREALLNGVDLIPELDPITVTGGRLNVFKSMEQLQGFCGTSVGPLAIQVLFPNPTRDKINVKYETPTFDPLAVSVFNLLGQLVLKKTVQPPRFGIKRFELDVSQLSSGSYFLQIGTEGEFLLEKFIKH